MIQKLDAAIARKLAMVREDLEAVRRKAAILGMQGGPHPIFFRVGFHEGRVGLLEWMTTAPAAAIQAKRRELEQQLGPALALKGGDMREVPADTVTRIAHLELLEYALGDHAVQKEESV